VQSIGSTASQVASGKLRVLAVTSDQRHPSMPSVPTLAEVGIKLPLRGWYGIVAPAGTPADASRWWNAEVTRLAAEPQFSTKFLAPEGILFSRNTPEEFGVMLNSQREAFADLAKYLGIKPE
jgi:tripartite-type tricarboxylate transporter receptor subunit TctC